MNICIHFCLIVSLNDHQDGLQNDHLNLHIMSKYMSLQIIFDICLHVNLNIHLQVYLNVPINVHNNFCMNIYFVHMKAYIYICSYEYICKCSLEYSYECNVHTNSKRSSYCSTMLLQMIIFTLSFLSS